MYMIKKINFFPPIFALLFLVSCKPSQVKHSTSAEPGMFKVMILYPNGDDKTFDMDYYEKKHMPMVAGFLGKNLKFYEIDKGITGRTPIDKPPYLYQILFSIFPMSLNIIKRSYKTGIRLSMTLKIIPIFSQLYR